jgi:hypothetical protein
MLHNRSFNLVWTYWLLIVVLLVVGLAGWPAGFMPVIILCSIQVLHFLWREGGVSAFPVQVRIAYLLLILVGQWDLLTFILWMQALGTTIELLLGYCTLARVMALMPWNRRKLLSWQLIRQVLFSAPVKGSVLERVRAQERPYGARLVAQPPNNRRT